MIGLGPLEPLIRDESITDIMVNGFAQIYIERRGKLELTDMQFRDNQHVMNVAQRIVTRIGRRVDETSPICDARLEDGSRVPGPAGGHAAMRPLVDLAGRPGPTVLAGLIGLLVASVAAAILTHDGQLLGPSRRLRRRIDRMRSGAATARAGRGPESAGSVRRRPNRTIFGQAGSGLIRLLPRAEAMRLRLDQAGLRLNVADYALLCGAAGLLVGLAVHLLYRPPVAIVAGLAIISATGVPHLMLARRITRRRRQFLTQFPDAIDLIVRGVRSGIPVAEALQAAGQELPEPRGRAVPGGHREHQIGQDPRPVAHAGGEQRSTSPELRFFTISLDPAGDRRQPR